MWRKVIGFILLTSCQHWSSKNSSPMNRVELIPVSATTFSIFEKHVNSWLESKSLPSYDDEHSVLGYKELFDDLKSNSYFSPRLSFEGIRGAFTRTIEFSSALKPYLAVALNGRTLKYIFERQENKYRIAQVVDETPISPNETSRQLLYQTGVDLSPTAFRILRQQRDVYCKFNQPEFLSLLQDQISIRLNERSPAVNSDLVAIFAELKRSNFYSADAKYDKGIITLIKGTQRSKLFLRTFGGYLAFEFVKNQSTWHILESHNCPTAG